MHYKLYSSRYHHILDSQKFVMVYYFSLSFFLYQKRYLMVDSFFLLSYLKTFRDVFLYYPRVICEEKLCFHQKNDAYSFLLKLFSLSF